MPGTCSSGIRHLRLGLIAACAWPATRWGDVALVKTADTGCFRELFKLCWYSSQEAYTFNPGAIFSHRVEHLGLEIHVVLYEGVNEQTAQVFEMEIQI